MFQADLTEIQRLKRLHHAADQKLLPFARRRHLTAEEEMTVRDLKKRKLSLKDRITRLESRPR